MIPNCIPQTCRPHDIAVQATYGRSGNGSPTKMPPGVPCRRPVSRSSWIPVARLGLLTGIDTNTQPGHTAPLMQVLQKLHDVSLIEELTGERLRLHPLVQEFAARSRR